MVFSVLYTIDMEGVKTSTLVFGLILLVFVAAALFAIVQQNGRQENLLVTSFEECAAAGHPVMESFPEQCKTPDGRTFVKEYPHTSNPNPITANGCAVAGCSSQLCVSADESEGTISTCEYRAEYGCYREAVCEPQTDGKCGWTQTSELKRCLADPPELGVDIQGVF